MLSSLHHGVTNPQFNYSGQTQTAILKLYSTQIAENNFSVVVCLARIALSFLVGSGPGDITSFSSEHVRFSVSGMSSREK